MTQPKYRMLIASGGKRKFIVKCEVCLIRLCFWNYNA